ncbi:MAG TPA: DUF3450 domain-containing protein [Desulfobacterales bacterium]|nr:DUF3450 domain-containing protein [Desulfobacterales bacterium]
MDWLRRMLPVFILLAAVSPLQCLAETHAVSDQIERPVREAIDIRQKTQKQQEQWRDEKQKRMARYESLEREQAELKDRRERLMEHKTALQRRIAAKTGQLERIRQISEQIEPYLQEVMTRLLGLYESDLPFLSDERRRRIDNLAQVMTEPDIAVSEKMRKTMETLMVEAEYGHTIEVCRETIDISGQETLVNIFRLGRIALFYQGLDGRNCGFYNSVEGAWQPLPDGYDGAIQTAMEIGTKRRPVELLSLPIGRLGVQ